MFDIVFDRSNETATPLGTFIVTKGNVTKGTAPLVTWFNDKSVIIAMNARSTFTLPTEHAMFDQLLVALMSKGIGIMYVESLNLFMNPKARFQDFLNGVADPTSFGMDLTDDQKKLPTLFAEVRAKFDAMFTPPKPEFSAGVNLSEFFTSDEIEVIDGWRKGGIARMSAGIRNKINSNHQRKAGLLRIVKQGGNTFVENDSGHRVSKTRFVSMFDAVIKPVWAKVSPNDPNQQRLDQHNYSNRLDVRESGYSYNTTQHVHVYADHIRLGCQQIPRAEVQAVYDKLTA